MKHRRGVKRGRKPDGGVTDRVDRAEQIRRAHSVVEHQKIRHGDERNGDVEKRVPARDAAYENGEKKGGVNARLFQIYCFLHGIK